MNLFYVSSGICFSFCTKKYSVGASLLAVAGNANGFHSFHSNKLVIFRWKLHISADHPFFMTCSTYRPQSPREWCGQNGQHGRLGVSGCMASMIFHVSLGWEMGSIWFHGMVPSCSMRPLYPARLPAAKLRRASVGKTKRRRRRANMTCAQ